MEPNESPVKEQEKKIQPDSPLRWNKTNGEQLEWYDGEKWLPVPSFPDKK